MINYQKAPFPWFGGKSKAAPLVWQLLGDVAHYVEPFYGTGAVLLNRPHPCNRAYFSETINDADGFVVNAWRAIQMHPEETARHASWPVSEFDKSARQIRVLKWRQEREWEKLAGTHDFCDPQIAGFWLYGVCTQIGPFDGSGAWTADKETGRIVKLTKPKTEREPGVRRNIPRLGCDGNGVARPQIREPGVRRSIPRLACNGNGVAHASTREPGVMDGEFHPVTMPELVRWFQWLSARLRHVRIVNGDWGRVCTPAVVKTLNVRMGEGVAGVFLDPPYSSEAKRDMNIYTVESGTVAHEARAWCLKNGTDPSVRIVLAGYDNEHGELEREGWTCHEWFSDGFLSGGMTKQQHRERLWSSPHCLAKRQALKQIAMF